MVFMRNLKRVFLYKKQKAKMSQPGPKISSQRTTLATLHQTNRPPDDPLPCATENSVIHEEG